MALSISAALSPTEAMKVEAEVALPAMSPVVAFCSATAPLTVSNTGRIAAIALVMRWTASAELEASRCKASILRLISSVASWVCTASAFTSVATTAKPRPAAPARAASIVEFNASSVVWRAIWEIRLTTLPIAADESRSRSTLAVASLAAALASSASCDAWRTWAPMPWAEWVNLSAASENELAVAWAALVRPVRASVRSRMVCSVEVVDCTPVVTEWAARSSCRISEPSSSSSNSRISRAESVSATVGSGAAGDGPATTFRAAVSGDRLRNRPNAMVPPAELEHSLLLSRRPVKLRLNFLSVELRISRRTAAASL